MGAWGTSLYANDSASDIRGSYVDKLRRGKSNEEVTQELIRDNQDIMGDVEEEPLFWFALADTQWNYGRLLPEVKEKALYFLGRDEEFERWEDSGEKKLNEWKRTLDKLKEKLLTPPPPEKKVSKYRLYRCKWQFGDVFSYRFSSDYSREKGFFGQYVVFRKVSEDTWWPGHIVPVVEVYNWIGSDIPDFDTLKSRGLLEQWNPPWVFEKRKNVRPEYHLTLLNTSERIIPKDRLTLLGNVPGDDFMPYRGPDYWTGYMYASWDKKSNIRFEEHIIDMYQAWNSEE